MKRHLTTVLLLAGIGFCLFWLFRGQLFAADFSAVAEPQLVERVAKYESLRKSDDWNSLFDMVAPEQRKTVGRGRFLTLFGSGVLRVRELKAVSFDIDRDKRTARVLMKLDSELLVDRLPPRVRSSLRVDDPAALRRQSDLALDWVWQHGAWYFRLDRNVLTGRDADGKEIQPVKRGR